MEMKKCGMTIMVILFAVSAIRAAEPVRYCIDLAVGNEYRIFEERVKVRDAPSTSGKQIGSAKIGESAIIVAKDEGEYDLDGAIAYWYRVRWNGIEGYVWGGLLAHKSYDGDYDGNGQDETVLLRFTTREKGDRVTYGDYMVRYDPEYRLARGNALLSETPFGKGFDSGDSNYFEALNLDFPSGVTLFAGGSQFGDGPGWNASASVFYLVGNEFDMLFDYDAGGFDDGGYGEYTEVKIEGPATNKTKNALTVEWRYRKFNDEENVDEIRNRITYVWNGTRFVER